MICNRTGQRAFRISIWGCECEYWELSSVGQANLYDPFATIKDKLSLLHVVDQTHSLITGAQQHILTACSPSNGGGVDQTMMAGVLS